MDLRGTLGVAYERSVDFAKESHIHDRHMLVCSRGSSAMNIVGTTKRYRADGRHLVWVPRHVPHADESLTPLYDTLAIYPSSALIRAAAAELQLHAAELEELRSRTVVVRCSAFFDELLERAARVR